MNPNFTAQPSPCSWIPSLQSTLPERAISVGRLDSSRQHGEALPPRDPPQPPVQADELEPRRTLPRPDQGGGELEGVGRPQRVNRQQPLGPLTHVFTGRDL